MYLLILSSFCLDGHFDASNRIETVQWKSVYKAFVNNSRASDTIDALKMLELSTSILLPIHLHAVNETDTVKHFNDYIVPAPTYLPLWFFIQSNTSGGNTTKVIDYQLVGKLIYDAAGENSPLEVKYFPLTWLGREPPTATRTKLLISKDLELWYDGPLAYIHTSNYVSYIWLPSSSPGLVGGLSCSIVMIGS